MIDRLKAMRNAIPPKVERREIKIPDEVPHYDDYRRFGADPWRRLGRSVWTDGSHVLIWAVTDPEPGIGTLIWGAEAQAVIGRYGPDDVESV